MPELVHFCSIKATMSPRIVGNGPSGMRVDFPFEGTATSPHWEGERPVAGVDYVTFRSDGNLSLDIHGVIGEKRDSVGYTATGVSISVSKAEAHPKELITFHTGNEELAWLNTEVAVAFGKGLDGAIDLDIHLIRP
ncbi:MAG TPA: DUF3237 family protein [Acidimicrobiia bacterium]|nr:DUF3237 family protein [Acidimicrobiia bacterium]